MSRSASPLAAGLDGLRARLAPGAAAGPDAGPLVLHAELPDSVTPLDLWSAADTGDPACWWDAADGEFAGIGRAGTDPVGDLRCFGVVPFAGPAGVEWDGLEDVGFVLPRWSVRRYPDGATLSLVCREPHDEPDRARALIELDRITSVLADGRRSPGTPTGDRASPDADVGTRVRTGESESDRKAWTARVRRALAEIEAGRFRKTVLARRVEVALPERMDASAIALRLRAEGAGRYRFGLRRGDTAFVGASPETLFRKAGRDVEVEALAGTFDLDAAGGSDGPALDLARAAEHLFGSGKDLEEHALVVRGIVEALRPLAASVAADEWPQVREARRLAHLSTTVRATLRPGVTARDLVAALHPTPAVGGLPREPAVAFLRRAESAPRGLFAGPIGWVDATGDACFAVAIRSALVRSGRATVFAGAGIVSASDPDAEWDETAAKLRWLQELIGGAA